MIEGRKKLTGTFHEVQSTYVTTKKALEDIGADFDEDYVPEVDYDVGDLSARVYILGDDENFYRVNWNEKTDFEMSLSDGTRGEVDGLKVSFKTPKNKKGNYLWAYQIKHKE